MEPAEITFYGCAAGFFALSKDGELLWSSSDAKHRTSMADTDAAEKGPDLAPDSVAGRVDNVITDLMAGRVMPKKVEELGKAVERTRQGYAIGGRR